MKSGSPARAAARWTTGFAPSAGCGEFSPTVTFHGSRVARHVKREDVKRDGIQVLITFHVFTFHLLRYTENARFSATSRLQSRMSDPTDQGDLSAVPLFPLPN